MKKSKSFLIVALVVIACICMHTNKVEGALQSNGGTPATKTVNDWITGIRQMQATGQALGLTDTIDETNLTSANKNLDIHMQKNTEYGALVILGASAYGNPEEMNTNGVTTTGNKTGVIMQLNKERVAAGMSNTSAVSMRNASGRYKNQYTAPTYTEKVGDAVETVGSWHGATNNSWIRSNENKSYSIVHGCLLRSYSGSVFSYYGYGYGDYGAGANAVKNWKDAHYGKEWASRAVVVVGSGV